ncbi:MAG TPA: hypothetical protein VFI31_09285, partial [Pirellulales bacterium]|nr:hypothetical protein [Pirellulales bacterium]
VSGGPLSGAAAFDLEPGGNVACPLSLAPGWQLVQVQVGGMEAVPVAAGPGKWRVPLHSARLPQRVEVAFTFAGGPTPGALALPIVELDGWPVEETLLTIQSPANTRVQIPVSLADHGACAQARLASAEELSNLPAETAVTTATEELTAWYTPWAHWLVFCSRQTQLLTSAADNRVREAPDQLLSDNLTKTARRLHVEKILEDAARNPLAVSQSAAIWQRLHESPSAACFRWTGPPQVVELRLVRTWRGRLEAMTASAWVGAVFLGVVLLPRYFGLIDLLRRWPQTCGVALGFSWWLLCQPSWLGWLLIAGSLISGLRSVFRPLPTH